MHQKALLNVFIFIDETADDLLEKEERWLNKQLDDDDLLLNLMNRKSVLS